MYSSCSHESSPQLQQQQPRPLSISLSPSLSLSLCFVRCSLFRSSAVTPTPSFGGVSEGDRGRRPPPTHTQTSCTHISNVFETVENLFCVQNAPTYSHILVFRVYSVCMLVGMQARIYTGWVKKVSCCTVIDISKARQ